MVKHTWMSPHLLPLRLKGAGRRWGGIQNSRPPFYLLLFPSWSDSTACACGSSFTGNIPLTKMASSSSGSSTVSWDPELTSLGVIGIRIKEIYQPADILDFSFAWEDEQALREFHEEFFPKRDAFGSRLTYPCRVLYAKANQGWNSRK